MSTLIVVSCGHNTTGERLLPDPESLSGYNAGGAIDDELSSEMRDCNLIFVLGKDNCSSCSLESTETLFSDMSIVENDPDFSFKFFVFFIADGAREKELRHLMGTMSYRHTVWLVPEDSAIACEVDAEDSAFILVDKEFNIIKCGRQLRNLNCLKRTIRSWTSLSRTRKVVLREFKADKDKRESAKYLLKWADLHYSYSGNVQAYYDAVDSVSARAKDKVSFVSSMADAYDEYKSSISIVNDANSISPGWLIKQINDAFSLWKDGKWARHLDFDEFCEYLLPYKCMELQPLTDWRSENRDIFRGRIDILEKECKEYNNNARVAALEVNRVMTGNYLKYTKQLDSYPIFRTSTLLSLPYGTCQEACAAAVQILRSKGIPVAVDFTPQWANRKYGHQWLSVLNHRHKSEAFSPFEIEAENDEHINRPMSKVYRMTYAPDKELLKRQKRGYRLPESLGNIFIRDVSDEYVKTENVVVQAFKSGKVGNNIYAATFNNQTWVPVACGHKKFGRRLSFKGLGRGVLYLPVQVLPDGAVEPVGEPFFLSAAGLVETIHSTLDKNVNAFLYRKYPVYEYVYRNESKLRGGVIQRSSSRDFLDAEDVVALPKDSLALAGVVAVDDTTSARYWRFASSDEGRCDMAELIFYDRDGRRLSPNLVKCGREVNPQNKVNLATAINDDDPLTFFSARGEDDIWVGFDFGIPVSIGAVNYFRRSDGNNLYPGYEYSLYFWHDGWHMIDRIEADKELCFNADVPENTLLWLVCNTTGTESRPFVLDNGEITWY